VGPWELGLNTDGRDGLQQFLRMINSLDVSTKFNRTGDSAFSLAAPQPRSSYNHDLPTREQL